HIIAGLGFGNIEQVDLFRIDVGGAVGDDAIIYSQSPNTSEVEFSFTDTSPPNINSAYYVRALQTGTQSSRPEMVWSSPVFAIYSPSYLLVQVDLGITDNEDGLSRVEGVSDGDTEAVTIGGREARKNRDPDDHYIYFDVDDSFAFQGNWPEAYITIDYYDTGSGNLKLQYDSSDPAPFPDDIYKDGGSVPLTGTNTWKEHTYHVTDAYFGNRQNGGADFRITGTGGITFYLDVVKVAIVAPPAPASDPNPSDQATGVWIDVDLSWSASEGATSYDVYFGTSSPGTFQVNQSGTTFDPGILNWTTDYFWRIDAVNSEGTTQGAVWTFKTAYKGDFDKDNDVDQEDFGYMQECFSGSGFPYSQGCSNASLDLDTDVDLNDFNLFQDCMSGANVLPGC
ncbi:MAG: fibronectin type III domain-containing protein, partial [Planctomycetota bacterium]